MELTLGQAKDSGGGMGAAKGDDRVMLDAIASANRLREAANREKRGKRTGSRSPSVTWRARF